MRQSRAGGSERRPRDPADDVERRRRCRAGHHRRHERRTATRVRHIERRRRPDLGGPHASCRTCGNHIGAGTRRDPATRFSLSAATSQVGSSSPANHSDRTGEGHFYRAHVIYSDDGGDSWNLGGVAGPRHQRIRRRRTGRRLGAAQHALLRRAQPAGAVGQPRRGCHLVRAETARRARGTRLPGQHDPRGRLPAVRQSRFRNGAGVPDRAGPAWTTAKPGLGRT